MQPTREPITGRQTHFDPTTPLGALSAFYRAFNERDLALVEANWIGTDEAAMDNPLGGITRGWRDIRVVYERIFSGEARVEVEFFDYSLHETPETFLAIGRERGRLTTPSIALDLMIRTSRWYRRVGGRWRQAHHHGSIEDPALLAQYQAAVR